MNVIKLELLKLRSKSRGWLGPILVFILIMVAFPLTVEISNKDLDQSFFAVLWIAILLVMMLSTEDIFLEDFNDGSLEQFAISNISLPYIIGSLFCLGLTNSANLAINILPILLITSYIVINVFSFGNALSLNKGSAL